MFTLYHNPRCSKSREALALLRENGIEPTIHLYLENPPSIKELKAILTKLQITPRELLRKSEEDYKVLALGNPNLSDNDIITAMTNHPKLIERPIAITEDKAVIGRPPEKVLSLIKK